MTRKYAKLELKEEYKQKVIKNNEEIVQKIDNPHITNDFLRIKNLELNETTEEFNGSYINKNAEVVIIVGRHTDLITGKKVSVTLDRLKIPHDMQVICPIKMLKYLLELIPTLPR